MKRLFKATVKEDTSSFGHYHKWSQWKEGDYVVGEYISTADEQYKGQPKKKHKIKVLETNLKVKDKDGKPVGDITGKPLYLNDQIKVNTLMAKVTPGMIVEVAYGGKGVTEDGTEYHIFTSLQAGHAEEQTEMPLETMTATPSKARSRGL